MEETKIRGYVHLAKISTGTEILGGHAQNTYRFSSSQGMNTAAEGMRKFLNEIGNKRLVKLRNRSDVPSKKHLKQEVDVFVAKRDLPNLAKTDDIHFICYATSYLDSIEDFKDFISIASN